MCISISDRARRMNAIFIIDQTVNVKPSHKENAQWHQIHWLLRPSGYSSIYQLCLKSIPCTIIPATSAWSICQSVKVVHQTTSMRVCICIVLPFCDCTSRKSWVLIGIPMEFVGSGGSPSGSVTLMVTWAGGGMEKGTGCSKQNRKG